MSGTVSVSYSESRLVQKVNIAWTSNASGDATVDTKKLSGKVSRVTFIPSGVSVPTAGYTVRLNDNDGVDILLGYGLAGLSATATVTVVPMINDAVLGQPSYPVVIDGLLSFTVANSGNATSGIVSLYLER